ncbi:MAG TPA: FUSC family protein, partial [Bryobacteraceae bacterium]|nr:FUSC family protein [Bryobacteraceae bacterium]
TILRYQRDKVDPWLALRNMLGVALPLAAGVAFGTLSGGIVVATGALNVAFSDSQEPYSQRARRMLTASLLIGFAVFGGALCGHHHATAILVATAWAFAAGMLVALSTTAADLGTLSLVVLVVFAAFPMSLEKAAISGLLAFAGGLLQTLLAVAFWPLRRYQPERRALADLYLELSGAAASPVQATEAPPASEQSTQAQNSLAALDRDHSIEAERYRLLLSQAERTRLSLLAMARLRTRIQREDPANPAIEILDRFLQLSSRALRSIGDSLVAGQPAAAPDSLQQLQTLAESLREPAAAPPSPLSAMLRDARFQMDALAGQLRSAIDLAAYATPAGIRAFERREARRPWTLRLGSTWATLRANLSLKSAACRHGIRLAMCIAIGEAVSRGLDWRRSYWLPMTIAIVLKTDFTATLSRGVLRLAGTYIGLLLATALFHLLHPSAIAEVALLVVFMFILRCFGPANYGIVVIAVTALVVLLIALTGDSPNAVMAARALNTTAGGVIALLAYWLWPTWERTQVPDALARMLEAYREYFHLVRESYTAPEKSFAHELDRARLAGRLARSNLEASVDRLLAEPGTSPETVKTLGAILASSHRLAHAMMALEASLATSHPLPPRDAFRPFADHVELTLYYLAAGLRGSALRREELPDLREDHNALVHSGDPLTERYALVNVETDRITNSLNTLSEEVLRWRALTPDT